MDSAKGSALEWALALLHAPGERHGLRQRPLPPGIEVLLGIAAGAMPDALAAAVASFGEPEAKLREAAQFYVREVMFFPQADAYRMLGVARDADPKQIKAHHRLLQRWLHPDRPQSQDDAVFAARVNSAWNYLRSPDRRRAYDEALQLSRPPEVFDSSDALRSVGIWMPAAEPVVLQSPWRRRLPVLALLALCAALALLAVRDMNREGEPWDAPMHASVATDVAEPAGISVPKPALLAGSRTTGIPARAVAARPPSNAPVRAPASHAPVATAVAPVSRALAQATPPISPASARRSVPATNIPDSASRPWTALGSPAEEAPMLPAAHEVASVPSTEDALPPFPRIQAARKTGEQLLRFMQSPSRAPPPIWNSPGIQSSAELLRQDLHSAGRVRLSGPQWQIGSESAVLTSEYIPSGAPDGSGTFKANLRWRDGYWLVTGLSLEHTP